MMLPSHRAPTHPGEMLLKEFLEPLQLPRARAARLIRISPTHLAQLIRGARALTPALASRLEHAFGMRAAFWLQLQANHDRWVTVMGPCFHDPWRVIGTAWSFTDDAV